MEPFLIDLETASQTDLGRGSRAYLCHESTKLMAMGFSDRGQLGLWIPGNICPRDALDGGLRELKLERPVEFYNDELPPEPVVAAIEAGRPFVAHNAMGFDRFAWSRLVGGLQPYRWLDTMQAARAVGLPGGLDKLGLIFGREGKDQAGKRLMLMLSKMPNPQRVPIGGWIPMLQYLLKDMTLLEQVWQAVGTLEPFEQQVSEVDYRINNHGITINVPYYTRLLELWTQLEKAAADQLKEETDGKLRADNVRSVQQVTAYLKQHGVEFTSLERKQLQAFFDDPEGWDGWMEGHDSEAVQHVVTVLRLRQQSTRATKGKVERALNLVEGDRIYNTELYHGAHTGRWSGRALQPHNLARGLSNIPLRDLVRRGSQLTVEDLRATGEDPGSVLSTLFRPGIIAPEGKLLGVADYGQIEARGVGWVVGERALLDAFADPHRDVYCEAACRVFGRTITKADKDQRQVAKQEVLGCGYGMSVAKFDVYCEGAGVSLAKAGTTAEACVMAYRESFPRVPIGWKALWWMFALELGWQPSTQREANRFEAVKGEVWDVVQHMQSLGIGFVRYRGQPAMRLPSGRHIVYRDAEVCKEIVRPDTHPNLWAATVRSCGQAQTEQIFASPRDAIKYVNPRYGPTSLFGGMLMENLVQALCRDLLADCLVRLEAEGFTICLHVHDEVVLELHFETARDDLRAATLLMSQGPAWAKDFPILVESFAQKQYTKAPFKDSIRCEALNGRLL
jgi:DNA polymerase bacteriophage-type